MELYNVHKNPAFCSNLQQKLTSVQAYDTKNSRFKLVETNFQGWEWQHE